MPRRVTDPENAVSSFRCYRQIAIAHMDGSEPEQKWFARDMRLAHLPY